MAYQQGTKQFDGPPPGTLAKEKALGRWHYVIQTLCGVQLPERGNKHVWCPFPGGHSSDSPAPASSKAVSGDAKKSKKKPAYRPGFRFDDEDGRGTWICSCGAGDGMHFLMRFHRKSFVECARMVLDLFGGNPVAPAPIIQPAKPDKLSEQELLEIRNEYASLWSKSEVITEGTLAWKYLQKRVPGLTSIPKVLKFAPQLAYTAEVEDGRPGHSAKRKFLGLYPAIIGVAQTEGVSFVTAIQREYLDKEGTGKLVLEYEGELLPDRKRMPSTKIKGGAIRLTPRNPELAELGVAEGVITALAAPLVIGRSELPVWATIDTNGMKQFLIPEWVRVLHIFEDNDSSRVPYKGELHPPGWVAAEELCKRADVVARVQAGTLEIVRHRPPVEGQDFADVWVEMYEEMQAAIRKASASSSAVVQAPVEEIIPDGVTEASVATYSPSDDPAASPEAA